MTNLNNNLREKIIDSIIKATTIGKRKDELKRATETRVRELCVARIPEDFIAATRNMPAEWFPHMASVNIKPTLNPILISMTSDNELRKMWQSSVSFEPIKHPMSARFNRRDHNVQVDDPESWEAKLSDLIEVANKIREDEEASRLELRRFLWSVKTYKQAIEKMPEIEAHLPDYTKPMPVVVSVDPLRQTLSRLGFK